MKRSERERGNPWVLGLTGPSGSGKSTVCALLRSGDFGESLRFIDADLVARQVVEPGSLCLEKLTEVFGRDILLPGGGLDRRKLGGLVFGDPERVQTLNRAILPFIVEEIRRRIQAYSQEEGVKGIILDAPTLFESGADRMCSAIASVLAPRELRMKRICARDGISRETAEKRLNSQLPDGFYRLHSQFALWNGAQRRRLEREVSRMALWLGLLPQRESLFYHRRQRRRIQERI